MLKTPLRIVIHGKFLCVADLTTTWKIGEDTPTLREIVTELVRRANAFDGLVRACQYAEDAMSGATFNLNGRRCSDLNDAIKKVQSALAAAREGQTT